MKLIRSLFIIACVLPASANANLYFGVKGGAMKVSDDIAFDDASNAGILLGGDIGDSGLAVEGEITSTVSAGSHRSISGAELEIFTLAGYGVFRSSGPVYFKGKAGLLFEYLSVTGFAFPLEGEAAGVSLGVGGGVRLGNRAQLELEYTVIEKDIDFLSLGVNFSF